MTFHPKVIDFFKKHNMYDEGVFKYLADNTMMIDYRDEEQRVIIGCFYIKDKKDKLMKLQINIPYVYDEITTLINIHELVHGIENYQYLGKKFRSGITIEALPLLYERIYIAENPSEKLNEYAKYLDNIIEESSAKEYKFGLKIREELLKNYNYDMHKMKKMAKKLLRKYRKQNW